MKLEIGAIFLKSILYHSYFEYIIFVYKDYYQNELVTFNTREACINIILPVQINSEISLKYKYEFENLNIQVFNENYSETTLEIKRNAL